MSGMFQEPRPSNGNGGYSPPLPEPDDGASAWTPRMIALWGELTDEQRLLFRGPAWKAPTEPMKPVRELVAFMHQRRRQGATLDDLLSVHFDAFDDAFGRGSQGEFHARWAREQWAYLDERERKVLEEAGIRRTIPIARFLQTARPPEFLVDRMIQRGRLHTLTARTFHGKTTTMCYLMLCVADFAMQFSGLHTEQGRAVLLAGENPDDTATKLQVACDYWKLNPATLRIDIIPGAFDLAGNIDAVLAEIARGGSAALIVPDTSSAYRVDPDEDDNQAAKNWAQNLRKLVDLPGKPTVVTPTHPVKNAAKDNLLPRGGSGFLNEVDSNLALWCDNLLAAKPTVELHWQGKHRGPNFDPIRLEMIDQPHPTFTFHDGSPVPLKVAIPATKPPSAFEGLDHATIARIFARLREEPAAGVFWSPDARAKYRATAVIAEEAGKTAKDAKAILAVWIKTGVITEGSYWGPKRNSAKRVVLNEPLIGEMLGSGRPR